ncbi:MAG: hypothetical protein RH980_01965 [Roseovarius confluentis]|jgi:hypothetical protein
MKEVAAEVAKFASAQSVCEMTLWKPPQGTIPEVVPISIDLDFSDEVVSLPSRSYTIQATRATIHLRLSGADIARGSRLGEHVKDTSIVAEVTQSVRTALESEITTEGKLEVSVIQSVFGGLTGLISRRKRQRKSRDEDQIIRLSTRLNRVVPRNGSKWLVVEPLAPNNLDGRYLGSAGAEEAEPLCIVTMDGNKSFIQVCVSVARQDLQISTAPRLAASLGRNKELIVNQLVQRALSSGQVSSFPVPAHFPPGEIILSASQMELCYEN